MRNKKLKEEWNAIPNRGILPNDTEARMWDNIRKATIHKYRNLYNWAAVACAVIVLSIGSYHSLNRLDLSKPKITSTITFKDDIRLISLPDGTRVWLNQNTEIDYPSKFSKKERNVTLRGEAFFEVKRDVTRPFIITSGAVKTTVLGTSFNVKAYNDNDAQVSVRTGKVKVESTQNTVLLERGYRAIYAEKTATVNKEKTNNFEPEWKKVLLYVDGSTLDEVITTLKRDHKFTVNYLDDDLKNLKIQGTLDTRQGFYETLQTIAFALEIHISPAGNSTYIIGKK
ncbi:ferric-dicitrate binding protein FerR (iron transport regulator) [Flavobacterium sp. 2755]|uniref:FecR family protein n=1 Tax=Flavobacterium sp. 2755 TaxID=2817765 RepID=UPI002862FF74|nr:FecR domain-containing protein [Flavobacterium sp. 2755]MDR6763719.1 ferric-dicitrate binding protein FerR (iron transport regulator) [Flavobacterium sp. 2755]